jgi:hypothetical protein
MVKGKPAARIELGVEFLHGRKHLPVVRLKRAAQPARNSEEGLPGVAVKDRQWRLDDIHSRL